MSTDYEIRCSCGDHYTRDNWRRPEPVAALISARNEFAAIHDKLHDMWIDGWDAWGSMFPGIFHFFGEHKGHEMKVFDEYGKEWKP